MLRQSLSEIGITTRGRGLYDFTEAARRIILASGLTTGLATFHIRHTSASLLVQENADPDVRRDLERFLGRLVPDGDLLYAHTAEGEDDMAAHVRTALTSVNLSVPIDGGRLALGTWQGLYLWEHRLHGYQRSIAVHLLGD